MRQYKPSLYYLTPYEQDTESTVNTIYKRYGESTNNQYIERLTTTDPITSEWTWGLWADRTTLTQYVPINNKYIDLV